MFSFFNFKIYAQILYAEGNGNKILAWQEKIIEAINNTARYLWFSVSKHHGKPNVFISIYAIIINAVCLVYTDIF